MVHRIDPIIGTVAGMHLWWYGLSYSLGFLSAHLYFRRHRAELGLSLREVYNLTLLLAGGVLIGGRLLVVYYEWPFYRAHMTLIPAIWLGGMATHGLILGGVAGVFLFCLLSRRPYRPIFDALAIPAACILGAGRIGNFIDGQIVGSVTGVPWAIKFPEADGFRHPVVLYDGLKNFLLIPILVWVRRGNPPAGRIAALFVFLYAFFRFFIDLFREYPITLLDLPAGQAMNLLMIGVGLILLARNWLRAPTSAAPDPPRRKPMPAGPGWRRWALAACLLVPLVIASDATRDIPSRYGKRHAGLHYSVVYPHIDLARLP